MSTKILFLGVALLFSWGCTEDLGPGKFASGLIGSQSPGNDPNIWTSMTNFQLTLGRESAALGGGVDAAGNWYTVGYGIGTPSKTWIVRKSSDKGASWTIVDAFNFASGFDSIAKGFTADSSGNIYVVGTGTSNTGSLEYNWIVRKSNDGGASWTTVDTVSGTNGFYAEASAVAVAPNGRIFVNGTIHDGSNFRWTVRSSLNGGTTWSTVLSYVYPASSFHTRGYGIAIDTSGNIYVSGSGQDTNSKYHWIVNKSWDSGGTWSSVDDFQFENGFDSESRTMVVDKSGNVFAGGFGLSSTIGKYWVVRKSSNGGTAWSTVDSFINPTDSTTNANSSVKSLAVDSDNSIYAAGFGSTFVGAQHTISIVRKSMDAGMTWSTDDSFQPVTNTNDASASIIAIDSSNYKFISGINWVGSPAWFTRTKP